VRADIESARPVTLVSHYRTDRSVRGRGLSDAQQRLMVSGLPKLDRIDLRILCHLQSNGRITNVELADAVGLSASPCLVRVKRLEKAGYIIGYGAQIQLQKLGDTQLIFTEVTLSDHRSSDFARFEACVRKVDEIIECHLVSGGYDYLLKFLTRNVQHYQTIIEDLLERGVGIEKYFSYVVIKSIFVKHSYPLEKFLDSRD
jgi:DNA-binding Lrp family transcriptional regulator